MSTRVKVLGALIIVNVVFFQQGILGWVREKWPERFGIAVDKRMAAAGEGDARLPGREAAE